MKKLLLLILLIIPIISNAQKFELISYKTENWMLLGVNDSNLDAETIREIFGTVELTKKEDYFICTMHKDTPNEFSLIIPKSVGNGIYMLIASEHIYIITTGIVKNLRNITFNAIIGGKQIIFYNIYGY